MERHFIAMQGIMNLRTMVAAMPNVSLKRENDNGVWERNEIFRM